MSILSSVTGIGINPFGKRKIKIDPMKALGTALTVGSMGGFGPVAGALSHVPGGAALVKGATKFGGAVTAGKRLLSGGGGGGVPQVMRNGQPISLSDVNPNMPADPTGAGDGGGGGFMDFLKGHAGDIAVGGLGALGAFNSARASKRQGQLTDEMLSGAKENWAAGEPLRAAGRARLLQPRPPVDWNAVYADPTNPFAQPKPPLALPAGAQPRLLRAG